MAETITYNNSSQMFSMTEEQALTVADEESPAYFPEAFEFALGKLAAVPRIVEASRSRNGMAAASITKMFPERLIRGTDTEVLNLMPRMGHESQ